MARPIWYADRVDSGASAGSVIVCTETGEITTHPDARAFAESCKADRPLIWTDGTALQAEIAEIAIIDGADLDVLLGRGTGIAMTLRAVIWDKCTLADRSLLIPDGALPAIATDIGAPPMPGTSGSLFESEARIAILSGSMLHWRERIHLCGLDAKLSIGATAAGVVPRTWRRAAWKLQRGDPWSWIRGAYYGGRVECYRPGWRGDAIEYDLKSAYGWSLSRPIPDWKAYDRGWRTVQDPEWLEATVEVHGSPGPLPVRDPATWRLSWPTDGILRGTWTRLELEQDDVTIRRVHRRIAGRWSGDLQPAVNGWLERRETTDSVADRRLMRLLCCSLAGKLCQHPVTWTLWRAHTEPPANAVPLALDRAVFAVPSVPLRLPFSCPQAGSWITARVRHRVRPALKHPAVIYTDTDSCHLPADAVPHFSTGNRPGDWSAKVRGRGAYRGIRQYQIGAKVVGSQRP